MLDEWTWLEAISRLRKISTELSLEFDAIAQTEATIREFAVLLVPPVKVNNSLSVNRADRALASAAQHYGAWLLTGDAPLIVECSKHGIQSRLPWEIVVIGDQNSIESNAQIRQLFRLMPLSRTSGHIFARVLIGSWGGMENVGKFTVADCDGVARISYDSACGSWVLELDIGISLRLPTTVAELEHWIVATSYRLPSAGKKGKIEFRACSPQGKTSVTTIDTLKSMPDGPPKKWTIGSSRLGRDYWNGHLRALVSGPQSLNKHTFRAITQIPEAAPNPFDSDSLRYALINIMSARRSGLHALRWRPPGAEQYFR